MLEPIDRIAFGDPKAARALVIVALIDALGRHPTDAEIAQTIDTLTRYM